jgi:PAS domain-containing protein
MASVDIGILLVNAAVGFCVASLALALVAAVGLRRTRHDLRDTLEQARSGGIAFLFEGEALVDATPDARRLLDGAAAEDGATDWRRLAGLLRHRFPGLDAAIATLGQAGTARIASDHGAAETLVAQSKAGLVRVTMGEGSGASDRAGQVALAAAEAELAALREVIGAEPTVAWKQAGDGTILWANARYFSLVADVHGVEAAQLWPPTRLFDLPPPGREAERTALPRQSLKPADGGPARWFTFHTLQSGDGLLCFGLPADEIVSAETALRDFVQTLSITYAELPVGLAIFDRERRLAMFNPALTDLTALDPGFLIARPTLFAFLDQLRDRRRIPEPRNYQSWRQRMIDLEAAAADGFLQEDWPLPSGHTYRVTGRPHPNGAVAFLFEDVSSEISLTRRFRSEVELGQSALDSLDEAIAVFSSDGVIVLSNAAYSRLWEHEPSSTLAETGINEATRHWQSRSTSSPVWDEAREFLAQRGNRAEWSGTVVLVDGRSLTCRFRPLPGGATLAGFAEASGALKVGRQRIRRHERCRA